MSGGHFDYQQHCIEDIADSLKIYIYGYKLADEGINEYLEDRYADKEEEEYVRTHKHTLPNRYNFSNETIKEFKKGLSILRKAYIYTQRIDWLMSGDDGEEDFHRRLKEDLEELKIKRKRDESD